MKVALIIKHFSLYKGGFERYAVNLARALVEKGMEVHVFANQFEKHGPESITWHKVPMIRKPSWLRVLTFARHTGKKLEPLRHEFDIIFSLAYVYPQDLYHMSDGIYKHWMHIRYPNPVSRWFHYLVLRKVHLVNLHLEKQIFTPGNGCRMIANSKLCRGHANQYYQFPEDCIDVIYYGVDHAMFNPQKVTPYREEVRQELGIPAEAPAIIYVSHNWKRKGLRTLLLALAQSSNFPHPPHVVILGRGKPKTYRKLCQENNILDRVHFIGTTEHVERFYGASDLLVLPTQYDPFANVCLEAMACGLPVITTSSNGAAEIIENGVNGYVQQDANDDQELYRLLEKCSDIHTLQTMGKAAWETVQPFTLERNLDETLQVFQRIVSGKGRGTV